MLRYLLTYNNVNFRDVIWHCATEMHSIAWLFRDGHIKKYQFTLHYIKNKHHCNWNLLRALKFRINAAILCRRSFHLPACTLCEFSQTSEASYLSISAGKASCLWAVYYEDPPSFSWVDDGIQQWGTLLFQSAVGMHLQKARKTHKKCMKSIN